MPRGESAEAQQELHNPSPPNSQEDLHALDRQRQNEAMDTAVEDATNIAVEDGEGPPPVPAEVIAAYEAGQRLKQEQQEFLSRDPNVIRARADFAKVDAEMLTVYTQMTESPDANKRAQAKKKYEKMCGVGMNNAKNGEFNLAVAAVHRAEDRSAAKFHAMKKEQEAKGLQSALDKKTKDIGAIESQLGAEAVPVAELKQVADLMRDAVVANTDVEIANEKVQGIPDFVFGAEPQRAFEPNILAPDARFDQARSEMVASYIQDANSLSVPDAQKTNTEFLLGLQQKGSELEQIAGKLRAEMVKSPDTQAKKDNLLALDNLDKLLIRKMDYINLLVGPLAHETKGIVDKNITLEAAQKAVGDLRRTAAMGFMVPYESRNDVKYLKGKYNEAMSFADKIIAYKNGVEGQNLSDPQKMEVYEAIEGVQDELDRHLASIDNAVKEAEKNDFKEQTYGKSTTGEQLIRTTVGMNKDIKNDRYKQMDDSKWFGQGEHQYDKNGDIVDPAKAQEQVLAPQKPKKSIFGGFGAKLAGGLASLAAAFSFGSSRAPERVQAPNFSEPAATASERPSNQTIDLPEIKLTASAPTALPDIAIKASPKPIDLGTKYIRANTGPINPDHPLVEKVTEALNQQGADAALPNSGWREPLGNFSGEAETAARHQKMDKLIGNFGDSMRDLEAKAAAPKGKVENNLEAATPKVKVTKVGTRAFGSQGKNDSISKLPTHLQQPMREIGADIDRSMKMVDQDLERQSAQTLRDTNAQEVKKPKDKKSKLTLSQRNKLAKQKRQITAEQRAQVKKMADEVVDPILETINKPKQLEKKGITDSAIAKRDWQTAFENVQLAKDTGQPLEIMAELQKDLDAAHDTYERLANPGGYTSTERGSALSPGELALSGDLSRVDSKMLDARMAVLSKQESAFNDKFAQATFEAQQKGGALAVAEISEKDQKALVGVRDEYARLQAEMVRRTGDTKSSSDTSQGTDMSKKVDLAPGGYTSTERGSDTDMSGGAILAPGTAEIRKPNLDRENVRYDELLRDRDSIEKKHGKNTLEYERAQKALSDFLGGLKG